MRTGARKSWTAIIGLLLILSPSTFLFQVTVGGNSIQAPSTGDTPDFTISLDPASLTISQGDYGQAQINLTSHNNFVGNIFWSTIGSDGPLGVSIINGENIWLRPNATWISTLIVNTTTWDRIVTSTGDFSVRLTATSGSLAHSVTIPIVIISSPVPTSDFSIKVSPDRIQLSPGGSQTSTITLVSIRGYIGNVSLTATVGCLYGQCPHLNWHQIRFNLTIDHPSTTIIDLSTDESLPPADYLIILNALDRTRFHSAPIVITVTAPSLSMDYQVASEKQMMTVPVGSFRTAEFTVQGLNGFAGEVQLARYFCCRDLTVPNISASLNSSSVTLSPGHVTASVTLNVTVTGALAENMTIFVIGSSGTIHRRWALLTIVVGSGEDFAIGVLPGITTIAQGTKPTNTNLLYIYSNTTSRINLAVTSTPFTENGPTITLVNYSLTPTPGRTYTSPINVSAIETTPAQRYAITIQATNGTISHETSFTLIVEQPPAPDYDLNLTASSPTILQGGTVNVTASINALQSNLYHYNASLTTTINPSNGITPTNFTRQLPLGYQRNQYSTILPIQFPPSTPAGTILSISVTGRIGNVQHAAMLSLTVKSSGTTNPNTPGPNNPSPQGKTAQSSTIPFQPYLLGGLALVAVILVSVLLIAGRRKSSGRLS